MKYFLALILVIFLSSCCSTKQAINNSPKQIAKVDTSEEIIESPQQEDNESNIPNEIIEETSETITNDNIVASTEAFNHDGWKYLLQLHVSETGNVNYRGFKSDRKKLTNYISSLSENMPQTTWSIEDKLAFWINAYNAMTVDLILRNYPVKSIKDIDKPWEQRLWKLGPKWYNLDEIEHQILRKMNEPRIHFAIVCASFSCPKLSNEAYTASKLESQLTGATVGFLKDPKRNTITQNNIKLSKVFKWFAKDFKQSGSLINFLNDYSEIQISNNAKKSFMDYNWDLND